MKNKVFKVTAYDQNHRNVGSFTTVAKSESDAEDQFSKMQSKGIYEDAIYCEVEEQE